MSRVPKDEPHQDDFPGIRSDVTRELFEHFVSEFRKVGPLAVRPTKTMIAIANPSRTIAYVTRFGKNFVHVVFPFKVAYHETFAFKRSRRFRDRTSLIITSGCFAKMMLLARFGSL